MDIRTAEAIAGELNAALEHFEIGIGGGSPAYATEVRSRVSRMLNRVTGETVETVGIQARAPRAWYWLTDAQVESMLRRARALTSEAAAV